MSRTGHCKTTGGISDRPPARKRRIQVPSSGIALIRLRPASTVCADSSVAFPAPSYPNTRSNRSDGSTSMNSAE